MPSQTTSPLALGPTSPVLLTARKEQEKERSLLLTRMLLRHLARSDAKLYAGVKAQIHECYVQRKVDDPWLVLDALQASLRATVDERHWRQAQEDVDRALRQATAPEAAWSRHHPPPPPQRPTPPTPLPVPGFAVDPAPAAVARSRARSRKLLLLRHAQKCATEHGRCAEPDCAATKALWRHLCDCTDNQCRVRHCLVSRSLMSHFRRCRGPCAVCDPVKEIAREELGRKTKKPRRTLPGATLQPAGACPPLVKMGGQWMTTSSAATVLLLLKNRSAKHESWDASLAVEAEARTPKKARFFPPSA